MGIRMNNKKNEFAMKRRQKTTNRGNENSPVTDNNSTLTSKFQLFYEYISIHY